LAWGYCYVHVFLRFTVWCQLVFVVVVVVSLTKICGFTCVMYFVRCSLLYFDKCGEDIENKFIEIYQAVLILI